MAKPTKVRRSTEANPRSRAAKRATSPSIDVDKSIRDAPRASDATPILAASRGTGVSKKQRKKHLTRGQRVRQEKGFARAEAVLDQLVKKIDVSKSRSKRREQRKGQWENVNGVAREEAHEEMKFLDHAVPEDDWQDVQEDNGDIEMKVANSEKSAIVNAIENPSSNGRAGADRTTQLDDLDLIS